MLFLYKQNYANAHQLADVLQKPLKDRFRRAFHYYIWEEDLMKQQAYKATKDVRIDTKMTSLTPLLCS